VPYPSASEEEAALVAQIRHDPDAIRLLYRRYVQRVFAYVAYRVSSRQDAEDLTSEIFLKVVESMDRFEYRGSGSLSGWVFRIAYTTVQQFYRVGQRWDVTALDDLPEVQSDTLPPDEALASKERFTRLHDAIATLPARRQEVVTLRFFGGLRNQEIAHIMGLDERTVASHLSRALEDLQQKVGQEGIFDE
jgi:RNA polymerase sigma-70 factor (ECF subfamily)